MIGMNLKEMTTFKNGLLKIKNGLTFNCIRIEGFRLVGCRSDAIVSLYLSLDVES